MHELYVRPLDNDDVVRVFEVVLDDFSCDSNRPAETEDNLIIIKSKIQLACFHLDFLFTFYLIG